LLIEIGAFPILGGWWLDVCLTPLTGGTAAERWSLWALGPPPLQLLAFWLVGLVHMLHVSSLLNQLRELVRWEYVGFFLRAFLMLRKRAIRSCATELLHAAAPSCIRCRTDSALLCAATVFVNATHTHTHTHTCRCRCGRGC
jgi:hypothetical protein